MSLYHVHVECDLYVRADSEGEAMRIGLDACRNDDACYGAHVDAERVKRGDAIPPDWRGALPWRADEEDQKTLGSHCEED